MRHYIFQDVETQAIIGFFTSKPEAVNYIKEAHPEQGEFALYSFDTEALGTEFTVKQHYVATAS